MWKPSWIKENLTFKTKSLNGYRSGALNLWIKPTHLPKIHVLIWWKPSLLNQTLEKTFSDQIKPFALKHLNLVKQPKTSFLKGLRVHKKSIDSNKSDRKSTIYLKEILQACKEKSAKSIESSKNTKTSKINQFKGLRFRRKCLNSTNNPKDMNLKGMKSLKDTNKFKETVFQPS